MNESETNRKRVGLALSGGFIRSVAGIGVIEVLEDNGIPIDMISGCSAGAGIAAVYAAGTLEKARDRLVTGKRREYWEVIFEPTIPRIGLLSRNRSREFFREFVGHKHFSDLDKPLYIVATDIRTLTPAVLDGGEVANAIQAALGVPGVFVPIRYENKMLVDGANFNLIPSKVLYEKGCDYVIAIDSSQRPSVITRMFAGVRHLFGSQQALVSYNKKMTHTEPNILTIIWRSMKLSSALIHNFHYSSYRYDCLVKPNVSGAKRWHVSKAGQLIEEGRKAALAALPQIKRDLGLELKN